LLCLSVAKGGWHGWSIAWWPAVSTSWHWCPCCTWCKTSNHL